LNSGIQEIRKTGNHEIRGHGSSRKPESRKPLTQEIKQNEIRESGNWDIRKLENPEIRNRKKCQENMKSGNRENRK
jgi:hypothetical protein